MIKKNILFITPKLSNKTGGKILSDNIKNVLRKNYNVIYYEVKGYNGSKLKKLLHAIIGYSHGMTISDKKNLFQILYDSQIDIIIFNHSYYGNVLKKIKNQFSNIPIITYFHNIEYNFHLDIFKRSKKFGNWLVWKVITKNERLCVIYSDYIIGLNQRDNTFLDHLYHRKFDVIIPMFLPDTYTSDGSSNEKISGLSKFGLFVGSLFHANYYGIKWLSKKVCPFINIPIIVVGKGFEKKKEEFKNIPNLIIIGEVDDLNKYYRNADFVISPIFDGSGMKTKTAEALMHGKTIIGTDEAFEGFEIKNGITGYVCNTKEEFINAINGNNGQRFNRLSRELYLTKYSMESVEKILNRVIERI